MIRVTVNDAKTMFPALVEAALRGEEVFITIDGEDGERIVRIVVADTEVVRRRTPGSAKGLIWMSDDFDEPLQEFETYMR